jgi:nucleoside-triphosphatase
MNKPLRIFITGPPGVGKSTLLIELINELKNRGLKVAGFYCPEVRENGIRVGFRIIDISSGQQGWLAKVGYGRLMVGKYSIVENDILKIANLVVKSLDSADVIALDEIGPMELKVDKLREIINLSLSMNKVILAVVHRSLVNNFNGNEIIFMNSKNRNILKQYILDKYFKTNLFFS